MYGSQGLMSTYFNLGFTKTAADPNIYLLFDKYDLIVLVLHVNDLFLFL
jgi:hypothetical protein